MNLDVNGQCVEVWDEHSGDATWTCPHGAETLPLYDHAEERTWRHLDSCQFQTYLHARIPRVACSEHGVVQVLVPWAEPRARSTLLFERRAIDVLRQCDVSGATRILRISGEEAWGLMERAVTRGRQRKARTVVRRIGVDEKAVAIDMWEPYIQATRAQVPDADEKIVFDRVHVMGYVGNAVDTVRKQEHRALMAAGDETLKGSTYLWLYSREHVPDGRRDEVAALRRQELKVGRAWALKETLRRLWHYVYPASGWKLWKRWYFWATHSRLEPMRKAAETIRWHIANIVPYYQHPVTNAMSEGLNSQIQKIKSLACGFRNIEHFKTAIYFHCGGRDLYPC